VPKIPLIPMGGPTTAPSSSDILAGLGDTYHKFELARLFSGNLSSMRGFIRENYKFHLDWFEDTILAAGLPKLSDPTRETLAVYAVVQRLVCELVEDGTDRGDRARDRVYGEVADPLASSLVDGNAAAASITNNNSNSALLVDDDEKVVVSSDQIVKL